jgi:hypothetical protein
MVAAHKQAYMQVTKQELPTLKHEAKSKPQWFPVDEATKITASSSRAACLILASGIVESLCENNPTRQ